MEQFCAPGTMDPDNFNYVSTTPIHRSGHAIGQEHTPFGSLVNCTMICRRRTFEELGGFFDTFPSGADMEFIQRAHFAGRRFYIDAATVALRRVHDSSLSRGGRWGMNTTERQMIMAEYLNRYDQYRAAGDDFDPRPFGALDRSRPALTDRVS